MKKEKRKNWFIFGRRGQISIMMVLLVPSLLWLIFYFEGRMQARYVKDQTQVVLDIATKAGALTGIDYQIGNSKPICVIPYDEHDQNYSGYHVTKKMLLANLNTLPEDVANQLRQDAQSNKIEGMLDSDLAAGGYVSLAVTVEFKPKVALFFNNYRIKIQSTSKCEVIVE